MQIINNEESKKKELLEKMTEGCAFFIVEKDTLQKFRKSLSDLKINFDMFIRPKVPICIYVKLNNTEYNEFGWDFIRDYSENNSVTNNSNKLDLDQFYKY